MSAVLAPLNRQALLLGMIQKEFPAYHPVLAMAKIAHNKDADLKTQLEAHKAVAKYVEPEVKSVEVRSSHEERRFLRVSLFEQSAGVEIDGATGEIVQIPLPMAENW